MKKKNLLLTAIAIFGLALISNAQVPNYVSTNGLVGWWPFNGNANDESLNGNNGNSIIGNYTTDRNNIANSSFYGDGSGSGLNISAMNNFPFENSNRTISVWFQCDTPFPSSDMVLFSYGDNTFATRFSVLLVNSTIGIEYMNGTVVGNFIPNNIWHNIVVTYNGTGSSGISLYLDGVLLSSIISNPTNTLNTQNSFIHTIGSLNGIYNFVGKYDDIGIWNRELTQQEITELYNASNCSNNLTISPSINQLQTGSVANFIATTSDTFPSFVWQSDLGQGFQSLINYGNYSGVNTSSLSISNVQLPNHTQQVRVISTSGECIDTSNVASINITDTCTVTINDTITTLISVTDTLVINTLITGLTAPNNSNTIKVFPNPANSHITIDFGNFASMNGYTLKITNSIGQTVYITSVNQQSSYVDLSTWSGNGIYFVQIIDTLNNTIENRKIVLQ
jgi:hypothetical protein